MKTILKLGLLSAITASVLLAGGHHKSKFEKMYQGEEVSYAKDVMMNKIHEKFIELENDYNSTTISDISDFMYQYYDGNYTDDELITTLSTTLSSLYSDSIDENVSTNLQELYEVQLFAKDIYDIAYAQWGLELFNTTANTQNFNTEILKLILDNYNIEYNATPEAGVYANSDIQALFDEYNTTVSTSINDALSASILIEEKLNSDISTYIENNISTDVDVVYGIINKTTSKHISSFNIALGNEEYINSAKKHKMDNGNKIVLKNTQLATAKIKKGWNIMSIPVTTATDITELLPEDASNSIVWTYDADNGWEYTKIELDENGTLSQSGYIQISPFQGFWILSEDEYDIDTYVTTEVETADTNSTLETPPTTTTDIE
jgi:hypothetical protein